jgi:class 3 adenylate cyclase/tetratricopeptide (TPR) repeat protein
MLRQRAADAGVEAVAEPTYPDGMAVCPKCGQENPPGFAFCGACGTPVAEQPPLTCATCGQVNPPGFRFCGGCGASLAAAVAVETEDERKVVTALFTDIVGSTARAEELDAEDVRARLAPYYARLRIELERYGGTVEKFIGDAVVALFGAPVAHENDPERAVRAALAIQRAIGELNAQDEWLDLHIRTAVHTGDALIVSSARASEGEGLASGDVMNTAARLQSGAPVDGIVVGEDTFRATEALFEYREGEPVHAKGKAEPVPVWEVLGEKETTRPWAKTPLVGRGAELRVLTGVWARARAERRPALATVLGPPGIGKSRLLLELCARVETEGSVHWGRCLPYGEGMTYWPVAEILRSAAGIRHDEDAATASARLGTLLESLPVTAPDELRTMAAALAVVVGVRTTPRGTYTADDISRAELHWGLRRVLQLLAQTSPLLLVFEDLHWAEPTLLDLLRTIADADSDGALLVVATGRPELRELDHGVTTPSERRTVMELEPLDEIESGRLADALLGDGAPRGGAVETLVRNAAGNPLFLEETVRMLADADALSGEGAERLPVPSTLQALIGSRLDALPREEKRVAQHASVIGATFWSGAVAHLGNGGGDPDVALAGLVRQDMVRAQAESSVAGDREYVFKHALLRDVAYERLPKGRRAALHMRFVDWMGALGGDDEYVEIHAYHLEQACLHARAVARSPVEPPVVEAVAALVRSAIKAERREGIREADRFSARAFALAEPEHPELALELRLRRGPLLAALGELERAADLLSAVIEEARERGRRDVLCEALVELGDIDQRQGRAAEAHANLAEARRLTGSVDDLRLRVRAVFVFAALRADFDGELEEAIVDLREAIAIAEELDDSALRVEGHLRTAALIMNLGRLDEAETELHRCLALARDLGSHRFEAEATSWLGIVKYRRGDLAGAEHLGLQAHDWLERTSDTYFQVQNSVQGLASYALARGDAVLAERWLREAVPVALEIGGWVVVETYRYLTDALLLQGRLADARELAEFAARNIPEEDAYARAAALLAEGAVAAADGRAEAARDTYCHALDVLEELNMPFELAQARIAFARALRQIGAEREAAVSLRVARAAASALGANALVTQAERELVELHEGAGGADPLVHA